VPVFVNLGKSCREINRFKGCNGTRRFLQFGRTWPAVACDISAICKIFIQSRIDNGPWIFGGQIVFFKLHKAGKFLKHRCSFGQQGFDPAVQFERRLRGPCIFVPGILRL